MLKKLLIISSWPLHCSLAFATPLQTALDSDAQYTIVHVSGTPEKRSVVIQRTGISGTSYSARQFNCVARTVRFMGAGTSLETLAKAQPDDDSTPIFKGSLSRTISEVACDSAHSTPDSPAQQHTTISGRSQHTETPARTAAGM